MNCLYILFPMVYTPMVAANIIAVSNYAQANENSRALVDRLVVNYRTFSQLELLENIPTLDDPGRCNENKRQYVANLSALLKETGTQPGPSSNKGTVQIDTKEGKKIFPFFRNQEEIKCHRTLTTKVLKMALQNSYADLIANLPKEQLEELRKTLMQRPEFSQLTSVIQSGFQDIIALRVTLVEKEVLLSKLLESYLIKSGYLIPHRP